VGRPPRHASRIKLLGQSAAIAALLTSGHVPDFGIPAAIAGPILIVLLVGLMNATNFLDNMNGMLGGIAGIALLAFGIHSATRGSFGTAAAQLALAGACAGFLPWNFPRARIFLGDAGSLFLGYSLGASAVLACHGPSTGWGRLGAGLMLGYPAFDMIFVVINRLRDGRKVYTGGRDHTNHRLASVMQCPKRTVLLLWLTGAALSASGLVVLFLDRPLPALLLSVLWTSLFLWAGARTVEGAGAAERSSGSLTPAPAWDAPEDAPPAAEYRAPREPRVAREPDADDLRERDLVAFMARGLVDHPDDVPGRDPGDRARRALRAPRPPR
jgi:hypothetical protein